MVKLEGETPRPPPPVWKLTHKSQRLRVARLFAFVQALGVDYDSFDKEAFVHWERGNKQDLSGVEEGEWAKRCLLFFRQDSFYLMWTFATLTLQRQHQQVGSLSFMDVMRWESIRSLFLRLFRFWKQDWRIDKGLTYVSRFVLLARHDEEVRLLASWNSIEVGAEVQSTESLEFKVETSTHDETTWRDMIEQPWKKGEQPWRSLFEQALLVKEGLLLSEEHRLGTVVDKPFYQTTNTHPVVACLHDVLSICAAAENTVQSVWEWCCEDVDRCVLLVAWAVLRHHLERMQSGEMQLSQLLAARLIHNTAKHKNYFIEQQK